jgi:hypothetical protein
MGMSGYKSAGPLRACVKGDDYCDPFFAGTLTSVKMLKTCVESAFVTERMRSAIVGCCLLFW